MAGAVARSRGPLDSAQDNSLMADAPTPVTYNFEPGTVVLALHGTLLYEAKILSVQYNAAGDVAESYLVHFQGWKKSWDETVSRKKVFEHNDDNLRIAHALLNGAKMRQQALRPVEELEPDSTEQKTKPAGAQGESPESSAKNDTASTEALFQLPVGLKRQLVDDWEFITKEQRLVDLPRTVTVDDILQKWLKSRKAPADIACQEVADGLRTYFNEALPSILLYRFERPQYNKMFHSPDPLGAAALEPSSVYGAEHLLRLLLKLPYMLESTGVDREMMHRIAEKVNELAKYMQKSGRVLFLAEYENASSDYITSVQKASSGD